MTRLTELADKIRGPIAYPTTPYVESGGRLDVDEKVYRRQIRHLIDGGIKVITPCGGTGEFFSLSWADWQQLVSVAADEAKGSQTLIMPSIGGGCEQALVMAAHAASLGCLIAQLTLVDPMFGMTEEGVYEYNATIARQSPIAIMAYKTKTTPLSVDLAERICALDNVPVFKDEAGDVVWFQDFMTRTNGTIVGVCGGGEELAPYYMLAGAQAFTTGVANLVPQLVARFYEEAARANWREVFSILNQVRPLGALRSRPGRMIPVIKEGYALLGIGKNSLVRPPVLPLSEDEKNDVRDALTQLGVL